MLSLTFTVTYHLHLRVHCIGLGSESVVFCGANTAGSAGNVVVNPIADLFILTINYCTFRLTTVIGCIVKYMLS